MDNALPVVSALAMLELVLLVWGGLMIIRRGFKGERDALKAETRANLLAIVVGRVRDARGRLRKNKHHGLPRFFDELNSALDVGSPTGDPPIETRCPECGPGVSLDEDLCCASCGNEATAEGRAEIASASPTGKGDGGKYVGWRCGSCGARVAGRWSDCSACGAPGDAAPVDGSTEGRGNE